MLGFEFKKGSREQLTEGSEYSRWMLSPIRRCDIHSQRGDEGGCSLDSHDKSPQEVWKSRHLKTRDIVDPLDPRLWLIYSQSHLFTILRSSDIIRPSISRGAQRSLVNWLHDSHPFPMAILFLVVSDALRHTVDNPIVKFTLSAMLKKSLIRKDIGCRLGSEMVSFYDAHHSWRHAIVVNWLLCNPVQCILWR